MSNQFSEKVNQIHDLIIDKYGDHYPNDCENASHDTLLEAIESNKDKKYFLCIDYRDVYSMNFIDSFEEIEKLITDSIFCGMENVTIFDLNEVKEIGYTNDYIHRADFFGTKVNNEAINQIKLIVKMSID